MSGIFFQVFFFLKKKNHPCPKTWLGFFFTPKKKNPEKNTQACLWNMRGSLPLLPSPPPRMILSLPLLIGEAVSQDTDDKR